MIEFEGPDGVAFIGTHVCAQYRQLVGHIGYVLPPFVAAVDHLTSDLSVCLPRNRSTCSLALATTEFLRRAHRDKDGKWSPTWPSPPDPTLPTPIPTPTRPPKFTVPSTIFLSDTESEAELEETIPPPIELTEEQYALRDALLVHELLTQAAERAQSQETDVPDLSFLLESDSSEEEESENVSVSETVVGSDLTAIVVAPRRSRSANPDTDEDEDEDDDLNDADDAWNFQLPDSFKARRMYLDLLALNDQDWAPRVWGSGSPVLESPIVL